MEKLKVFIGIMNVSEMDKVVIPCLFERVGEVLHVIGVQKCRITEEDLVIKGLRYKIQDKEYEYLTQDAIDYYKHKEGIIININGLDYKCPNKKIITLYSDGVHITDKQGRWRDYHEKGAVVQGNYVGCLDFEYYFGNYIFHCFRPDKEVPDSGNAIDQIIKSMIVLGDLCSYLTIPKKRKKSSLHLSVEVIHVDTMEEKFKVINAKMRENKIAMVFVRGRNTSTRDTDVIRCMGSKYSVETFAMVSSSFYYLGGMTRMKYVMRKEINWQRGKLKITNIWKQGYRRICVKRLDVFGEHSIQDIPGLGLVGVVYVCFL